MRRTSFQDRAEHNGIHPYFRGEEVSAGQDILKMCGDEIVPPSRLAPLGSRSNAVAARGTGAPTLAGGAWNPRLREQGRSSFL
jgi:hypothetical protein